MRLALLFALATSLISAPAARAQAINPVGDYTWSFDMQEGAVHGTLSITRADSGYHAVFTSDHTEGPIVARSVTVNDNHVVVNAEGDFGQFAVDMKLGDGPIVATYKLTTNDGPTEGPITIERVQKTPSNP